MDSTDSTDITNGTIGTPSNGPGGDGTPAAGAPPGVSPAHPAAATDDAPPQPLIPPILVDRDLPGPLSLKRLSLMGSISTLDVRSGYWTEHADTLYGRAMIMCRIIPFATAACAFTALWVWMGGDFPDTVDVLSRSHYRTAQHGRRVRVFSRKVSRRDLARIGSLSVTRPARTVCDIASLAGERPDLAVVPIADLMEAYEFTPGDCMTILDENPCMATAPQARAFLRDVSRVYALRRPPADPLPVDVDANAISPA
ncbi:hypothetical protein JS528_07050 [Bifidobacterium sp. MA2]|uniref:Uncharacterized protein n=1 Tax=Bifidobacterium santillanense TaxID=2809028 RepID=A0ABS5UQI6_9BIFI|nr:hypothetical protein [Bifidobacterium santillanense]MBT1173110.1 hypothetical protein [Bifidobacterium santillanense]